PDLSGLLRFRDLRSVRIPGDGDMPFRQPGKGKPDWSETVRPVKLRMVGNLTDQSSLSRLSSSAQALISV
ncbi:hypothetical protein, partial [Pseudomonas savastanoi]